MIPRRAIHIINGEFRLLMRSRDKYAPSDSIGNWERVFADYINVKDAITAVSGRQGLRVILASLGLREGDEVIIPAYTLKDLIGIINSLGLIAVPADIDPLTFNIAPESILKRVTGRSRVILATHIFGAPCRIDSILKIAKERGIVVIEDCAHAAGAEFKGKKVGGFGEASLFSFETIKPINTYGGGMVVTNNKDLAIKIRQRIAHDKHERSIPIKKIIISRLEQILLPTPFSFIPLYCLASEDWSDKIYRLYRISQKLSGFKHGFSEFQARLGIAKIKTLDNRISRRRAQAGLFKKLLDSRIALQHNEEDAAPNYYFFVAILPFSPVRVRKFLLRHGIDSGIGAEITDDCAKILCYNDCVNTVNTSRYAIQLPLHEGVSQENIYYIADKLNQFIKKHENSIDRPVV